MEPPKKKVRFEEKNKESHEGVIVDDGEEVNTELDSVNNCEENVDIALKKEYDGASDSKCVEEDMIVGFEAGDSEEAGESADSGDNERGNNIVGGGEELLEEEEDAYEPNAVLGGLHGGIDYMLPNNEENIDEDFDERESLCSTLVFDRSPERDIDLTDGQETDESGIEDD